MQVVPSGDQIWNYLQQAPSGMQCCHLVANFGTNANGAIWWLKIFKWYYRVAKLVTNAIGDIWWLNVKLVSMQIAPFDGL